ncbi:hypothetical protein HYS42_01840 [Candidatus Saccharibacteria bacterium]|nr:hypothetical protein [Candidatus Saccharibacteria bacterium]
MSWVEISPLYYPTEGSARERVGTIVVTEEEWGATIRTELLGMVTEKKIAANLPFYGLRVAMARRRSLNRASLAAEMQLDYPAPTEMR